jgi:hypothetical protein
LKVFPAHRLVDVEVLVTDEQLGVVDALRPRGRCSTTKDEALRDEGAAHEAEGKTHETIGAPRSRWAGVEDAKK